MSELVLELEPESPVFPRLRLWLRLHNTAGNIELVPEYECWENLDMTLSGKT